MVYVNPFCTRKFEFYFFSHFQFNSFNANCNWRNPNENILPEPLSKKRKPITFGIHMFIEWLSFMVLINGILLIENSISFSSYLQSLSSTSASLSLCTHTHTGKWLKIIFIGTVSLMRKDKQMEQKENGDVSSFSSGIALAKLSDFTNLITFEWLSNN